MLNENCSLIAGDSLKANMFQEMVLADHNKAGM